MNPDRGLAGLKGEVFPMEMPTPNKDDNLFITKIEGVDGAWDLYAIDFGFAFLRSSWGLDMHREEWGDWLLGVVPLFVECGLLLNTLQDHRIDVDSWLERLDGLDLDETLRRVIDEIPVGWHLQCEPKIGAQDYADLLKRLNRSANTIRSRLDKYNGIAARYDR